MNKKKTSPKDLLKSFVPPVFAGLFSKVMSRYGWFGDYRSWNEALSEATGYDAQIILDRVKDAMMKIARGDPGYERDGVLFPEAQYSWPILANLLKAAALNRNRLDVLDFGGSLGTLYVHFRRFIAEPVRVIWGIVEQPHFVRCGKRYFETEELKFYLTIEDCLWEQSPNALLLSSVLQYLRDPYIVLQDLIERRFEWVLVDRTPFVLRGKDRLTVQRVQEKIYPASYPCWFFSEDRFMDRFLEAYQCVARFDALDRANIPSRFLGFVFRLRR